MLSDCDVDRVFGLAFGPFGTPAADDGAAGSTASAIWSASNGETVRPAKYEPVKPACQVAETASRRPCRMVLQGATMAQDERTRFGWG